MTIYIIDTNLIFSASLNLRSGIAEFIFLAEDYGVELIAPSFLKNEMEEHFPKLQKISGLTEEEVRKSLQSVYAKIRFIDDYLIPIPFYVKAAPFVRDVDPKDLVFVALSSFMDEILWTGDKKLHKGLLAKGYPKVITFDEIKEIHNFK